MEAILYVESFKMGWQDISKFYPGTLVSSTDKSDSHNITEMLLKVALNTITSLMLTYL
jgi:hypothetical protein